MTSPYKCVLLVGATSGIGASMADKLIEEGAHVVAVGRRQHRLDAFVEKHGTSKASSIAYDITDEAKSYDFVARYVFASLQDVLTVNSVVQKHPDLDCVFLNAGFQRPHTLSKPDELDLAAFHNEIRTNFTAIVHFCMKFLPHLLQRQRATLVIPGSLISLVPAVSCPAYSASKAALHAFFECLRRQNQGSSVKFVEISPPLVQCTYVFMPIVRRTLTSLAELHDYMGPIGKAMGMPVDEFVAQAYAGLLKGNEWIDSGLPGTPFEDEYRSIIAAQQSIFKRMSDAIIKGA